MRIRLQQLALTMSAASRVVDPQYPGTAVARLKAAHERVASLKPEALSGEWESVRQKILWCAGLKDLQNVAPGQGYTGHAFNDANHCDATTMLGEVAHNLNEAGANRITAIAVGNRLGPGIEVASIPELGEGGTWSTCTNGCHLDPPQDVAHVQFRSRIAFKCERPAPDTFLAALCAAALTRADCGVRARAGWSGARRPLAPLCSSMTTASSSRRARPRCVSRGASDHPPSLLWTRRG